MYTIPVEYMEYAKSFTRFDRIRSYLVLLPGCDVCIFIYRLTGMDGAWMIAEVQ